MSNLLLTAVSYLGGAAFCYFTVHQVYCLYFESFGFEKIAVSWANWREVILALPRPVLTAIICWWLWAGQLPTGLQYVGLVTLAFATLAADPQLDFLRLVTGPFIYLVFEVVWLGALTAFAWQVSGGKWVPTLIYAALVGLIRVVRVARLIRWIAKCDKA